MDTTTGTDTTSSTSMHTRYPATAALAEPGMAALVDFARWITCRYDIGTYTRAGYDSSFAEADLSAEDLVLAFRDIPPGTLAAERAAIQAEIQAATERAAMLKAMLGAATATVSLGAPAPTTAAGT